MSRLSTKPTKWHVHPAKTQISLGFRPVLSESSVSTWRKLESLATHWAHKKDSDQTGRMPRLIWVFAGRIVILLVLSRGGSNANSCQILRILCLWLSRLDHVGCLGIQKPFVEWFGYMWHKYLKYRRVKSRTQMSLSCFPKSDEPAEKQWTYKPFLRNLRSSVSRVILFVYK